MLAAADFVHLLAVGYSLDFKTMLAQITVSYTHLDVYKRQVAIKNFKFFMDLSIFEG